MHSRISPPSGTIHLGKVWLPNMEMKESKRWMDCGLESLNFAESTVIRPREGRIGILKWSKPAGPSFSGLSGIRESRIGGGRGLEKKMVLIWGWLWNKLRQLDEMDAAWVKSSLSSSWMLKLTLFRL